MNKKIFLIVFLFLFVGSFLQAQETLSSSNPNLKFRTITKELTITPQQQIHFLNIGRPFRIHKWNGNTVKVVAKIATKNIDQYTDEQLFETLRIFFEDDKNSTTIMSYTPVVTGNGAASLDEKYGEDEHQIKVLRRLRNRMSKTMKGSSYITNNNGFEIFVPASAVLNVDNSYARILLETDLNNAKFLLNTATLEGKNIESLSLTSTLSNIRLENINTAVLDLNNDQFKAYDINSLNLGSTSSTINYRNGQLLKLMSRRDKITAGTIGNVEGTKHFGELRIAQLQNSLKLEGENADVYVQELAANVRSIYLKNSWANVKLPLNKLSAYKLNFTGYATVFAPFAFEFTKPAPDELTKRYFNYATGADANITIDITCPQCTVDFK